MEAHKEALERVKQMEKPTITPVIAAQVMGCDPQFIRVAARDCPSMLGFPVVRIGTRTKIPRVPFIRFLEGKEASGG